jgi:hypothetical protein
MQREEEEKEEGQGKLQRQEEEKEEPQAKSERQEEEEKKREKPQKNVQLQADEDREPQTFGQRQEEKEAQPKSEQEEEEKKEAPQPKPQLQEEDTEEPQSRVQRQAEEEDKAQTKSEALPGTRNRQNHPELDRVEKRLSGTKGKGELLDKETRIGMETGLGADFSGVRLHTGPDAVEMSRELKAQAFTLGKDIFFNTGKYEPESARGKSLLAHELTHVVQQGAAQQKPPEGGDTRHDASRNEPQTAPPPPAPGRAATEKTGPGLVSTVLSTPGALVPAEPAPGEVPKAEPVDEKGTKAEKAPDAETTIEQKREEEAAPVPLAEPVAEGSQGESGKMAAKAGPGVVAASLRNATKPVFEAKKKGVTRLATALKTKEPAEVKLTRTEKAVAPPAREGESRVKAGQVETVDKSKPPAPSEQEAKDRFDSALQKAVPATLEEVDTFKETGKARMTGEAVRQVVTADTQEVKSTYQEIDSPSPSSVPEEMPEDLPEIESPPEMGPIEMGEGVVGEVPPEQTDMSGFGEKSDELLRKEEIKEEHLELVDEGELAEAKRERQTVKDKVREAPAEVRKAERQEKQKVSKALLKEEQEGTKRMQQERRKELKGARDDQVKTKSKIETKRQAVTDHIHGVYEKANATVKQKLDGLEKKSLVDFDEGQRQAARTFEEAVNRRIDIFKTRRYDRWGGSLLWLKDKLLGMEDLPEVKEIFNSEKTRFIAAVDQLIKRITAENKRIVQECREIVGNARKEIEKYVRGLGPELRKTGDEALKDMKGKLADLDRKVNAKEQELKKKLAEKREAAIKAIDEKIAKMKEEMSGLLSNLGRFLLNAMIKFFKWALKKAGYPSDQVMGIINKGKEVIRRIVTDPVGFIKNLIKAVRDGIDLFQTNIRKHLIAGLMGWLTGAMADVPITLPDKWDLKGILHLILQVLGVTWNAIRTKLVKRLGEKLVRIAERSVDIVKRLTAEGPMALWEMIKEKAEEIKDQVMESIRNWAIFELVKQGIIKLVSFLNPVGAIIQAILAIYNTIMFFVENWDRIVQFVKSVFNSIGEIALGRLSAAAQAIERTLGMTIPIILAFLARLLGLSGIGKTVTGIIKKIRKPIDKIVNKVVEMVVKLARKLVGKVKEGAKALKEKGLAVIQWWKKKKPFKAKDGRMHILMFRGAGSRAKLGFHSEEFTELKPFLEGKAAETPLAKQILKDMRELNAVLAQYKHKTGETAAKQAREEPMVDMMLARIAVNVGKLIGPEEMGTENMPYPILYPKRPVENYRPLYLGPRSSKWLDQKRLAKMRTEKPPDVTNEILSKLSRDEKKEWARSNYKIDVYKPGDPKRLPGDSTDAIGIDDVYKTQSGKKFQLKPNKTEGGKKINEMLKPFGFSASDEGMDGDHVLEMQLGGPNDVRNLWPLKGAENRSSGSTLSRMEVPKPDGTKVKMTTLKKQANKGKKIWLVIAGTLNTKD